MKLNLKEIIAQCCICKDYSFDYKKPNEERKYFKAIEYGRKYLESNYYVSSGLCPPCYKKEIKKLEERI